MSHDTTWTIRLLLERQESISFRYDFYVKLSFRNRNILRNLERPDLKQLYFPNTNIDTMTSFTDMTWTTWPRNCIDIFSRRRIRYDFRIWEILVEFEKYWKKAWKRVSLYTGIFIAFNDFLKLFFCNIYLEDFSVDVFSLASSRS